MDFNRKEFLKLLTAGSFAINAPAEEKSPTLRDIQKISKEVFKHPSDKPDLWYLLDAIIRSDKKDSNRAVIFFKDFVTHHKGKLTPEVLTHGLEKAITPRGFIGPGEADVLVPPYDNPQAQVAVAKILIDAGANVNFERENNYTMLHQAALSGPRAMVQLLVERGADPKATTRAEDPFDREDVVDAAANGQNPDIIRYLGSLPGMQGAGSNSLVYAAIGGYVETVRALLSIGVPADTRDRFGHSVEDYLKPEGIGVVGQPDFKGSKIANEILDLVRHPEKAKESSPIIEQRAGGRGGRG